MKKYFMIFGNFPKNERKIRIDIEIHCSNCQKQVPGGLQTGEKYFETEEFKKELEEFKKKYLCGVCRDKKRIIKREKF